MNPTLFSSGIQMVGFMAIKWFKPEQNGLVFERLFENWTILSRCQLAKTKWWPKNGPVLRWWVPSDIDYSKTRLVQFSDGYCTFI